MPKSADLIIRILGDAKGAQKATADASSSVGKLQKGIGKAALPAAAVATAVVGIGVVTAKAAASAEQSIGGVQAVYGKYADTVVRSSQKSAQSVGLSADAYRTMAAGIGGQLKAAGVPMDQLAGKTDSMIRTAADLAATYGGTTQQAVEALGSALRGEADPAERFNLQLSDSVVQAELAARGQDKLKGAALANAKAAARMALITKQSADAQGMFAEESDTAAGQVERAKASYEDASAALGAALLPAMTKGAQLFASIAQQAAKHPKIFMAIVVAIGALAAAILIANAAISVYTIVTTIAASATAMAWIAAIWPILLVVAAIAAVVAVVILLWKKCAAFRGAVLAIWSAIQTAFTTVANTVKAAWAAVWPALQAGVRAVAAFFKAAFTAIGAAVRVVTRVVAAVWKAVWPPIQAGLRLVAALFKLHFAVISVVVRVAAAVIRAVLQAALRLVQAALRPVVTAFRTGMNLARAGVNAVASALRGPLAGAFRAAQAIARSVGSAMAAGLRAVLGPISSVASALRGSLSSAFSAVGRAASGVGSAISRGLSGITGVINSITGAVQGLISALGRIRVPKISIPKIPGLSMAAPATSAQATRMGALSGPVPMRGRGRAGTASSGPTIVIQGAIDPEATARQIQRLLNRHTQRVGLQGALKVS